MSAETAAILDEAANVIRRNGWVQGRLHKRIEYVMPEACPVCAMGAINIASVGRIVPTTDAEKVRRNRAAEALENYLKRGIPPWNDDIRRTAADVIATLEAAARAEREAAS